MVDYHTYLKDNEMNDIKYLRSMSDEDFMFVWESIKHKMPASNAAIVKSVREGVPCSKASAEQKLSCGRGVQVIHKFARIGYCRLRDRDIVSEYGELYNRLQNDIRSMEGNSNLDIMLELEKRYPGDIQLAVKLPYIHTSVLAAYTQAVTYTKELADTCLDAIMSVDVGAVNTVEKVMASLSVRTYHALRRDPEWKPAVANLFEYADGTRTTRGLGKGGREELAGVLFDLGIER